MALSLNHPCSTVPPPLPLHATHPGSRRWSRVNRYSMLSDDDWQEGGAAIPLVNVGSNAPPRSSVADPNVTLSYNPQGRTRRSGVMSWGMDWGPRTEANKRFSGRFSQTFDYTHSVAGGVRDDDASRPRTQLRKRKRWDNSIGSTTATVLEGVQSTVGGISGRMSTRGPAQVPPTVAEADEQEGRGRERVGKRRRITRVLKGLAASLKGLGSGGSISS
ncbi:MAG: hypothetical protein Q9219_001536 [cf. Caloplaca sp. 3 TL-2023]